jgi:hypothetical protein
MFGISLAVIFACAVITAVWRRHIVLVAAQPEFLTVVLVGAALSSFAIPLFAVQENWACMGSVWCYGI